MLDNDPSRIMIDRHDNEAASSPMNNFRKQPQRRAYRRANHPATGEEGSNNNTSGTGSPRMSPIKRLKSNEGLFPVDDAYRVFHNRNSNGNGKSIENGDKNDEKEKDKQLPQQSKQNLLVVLGVALLLVMAAALGGLVVWLVRQEADHERTSMTLLQHEIATLEQKLVDSTSNKGGGDALLQTLQQQLDRALHENSKLLADNVELVTKKSSGGGGGLRGNQNNQNDENEEFLQKRVDALERYKQHTQQGIANLSRSFLSHKYGPGPHQVRVFVQLTPEKRESFVLELASEHMPHTTLWFLEQVSLRLYDGCNFYRNAGHLVQMGPIVRTSAESSEEQQQKQRYLTERFDQSGYQSILFQEYSEAYPHSEYTIAYAGRPGGPDLYINLLDNTEIHGPGGQAEQYKGALPEEADSCFGRIIQGRSVIDQIHRIPTIQDPSVGGANIWMEQYVPITGMRILNSNERVLPEPHTR